MSLRRGVMTTGLCVLCVCLPCGCKKQTDLTGIEYQKVLQARFSKTETANDRDSAELTREDELARVREAILRLVFLEEIDSEVWTDIRRESRLAGEILDEMLKGNQQAFHDCIEILFSRDKLLVQCMLDNVTESDLTLRKKVLKMAMARLKKVKGDEKLPVHLAITLSTIARAARDGVALVRSILVLRGKCTGVGRVVCHLELRDVEKHLVAGLKAGKRPPKLRKNITSDEDITKWAKWLESIKSEELNEALKEYLKWDTDAPANNSKKEKEEGKSQENVEKTGDVLPENSNQDEK